MPARRRFAAVLAVLALGIAPGAALAQSGGAGDDQYVDPIGGNTQQQKGGGSNSSSGTSTGPALSATPTLSAQTSQSGSTAAPVASSGQTLPRTGLDARAVAALGLVLLVAGAALRLRLRDARL